MIALPPVRTRIRIAAAAPSDRNAIADVLDAWFPPAPGVVAALERDLPFFLRTSPRTGCEGVVRTIAQTRGVDPGCILSGAGSSDLIFQALRQANAFLTRAHPGPNV